MTTKASCKDGGETRANGNCTAPAPDGFPAQCVGQWAADKHYYLQQYIEATREVRSRFLPPKGSGGAAFIDLFAGPGIVRVRDSGEIREGSPMVALRHAAAPFTRVILCDLDSDNANALRARTSSQAGRVSVIEGDCNDKIDHVAAAIPKLGLNIALVDPFGLRALKFSSLKRLAGFKRMDLVIHFPTGDIKRNLGQSEKTKGWLDDALGTDEWARTIASPTDVAGLIDVLKRQLGKLGYQSRDVRSEPIKNNQKSTLYHLVYASKNKLGDKIWQSITKNKPSGQKGWDF
jgi:three-Cys-motif partner protein